MTLGEGSPAPWALGLLALSLTTVPLMVQAAPLARTLVQGVEDMRSGLVSTPEYLGGSHPDWHDNNDHCYSIYFRIAIREGHLTEQQAEQLMARMQHGDWLGNLFPDGYTEVVPGRGPAIPAGHLISMDKGDHVMMSTGRLLPNGHHEVYSFKGGGPETPVWGDSVGWDPAARIHVTTLEAEIEALKNNDQPVDNIRIVAGRSALGL